MKKFIFLTILGSAFTILLILFIANPEQLKPYFGDFRKELVNFFRLSPSPQDENYQEWLNEVSFDPILRNKLSENDFKKYDSEAVSFLYPKNWTLENSENIRLKGEGIDIEVRSSEIKDSAPDQSLFNGLDISASEFGEVLLNGTEFSKELSISNTSLKLDSVSYVKQDMTIFTFKHSATKVDTENPKLPSELPNQIIIFVKQNEFLKQPKIAIVKMVNSLDNFSENQFLNKANFEVFIERFELK